MEQEDFNELIRDLKSYGKEVQWIEFKNNNFDPKEIGEYISALSNSACYSKQKFGYLIFGIEDLTLNTMGTNIKISESKRGNEDLELWLLNQLDPKPILEIIEKKYENKDIVVIKIGATRLKPLEFQGNSYIRINSCKTKLSNYHEIERKIWHITDNISFEEDIALESIDEDKILELLDYPSYFSLMNLSLPNGKEGIIEKFVQEKLIIKNNLKFDLTNLGAILFAQNLSQFPRLKRKSLRIIIYENQNKLKTKKEYSTNKGYAIDFIRAIEFILDQLPSNEVIESAIRKEIKMYPEIAIRELLANAIIHQDFYESGTNPTIEIFSDRIEFTNPGQPLININRLLDHPPKSRNEILAGFLRRINFCEERGSGIDKVVDSVELFQLPAPNFFVENNFMKVILYAHKSFRKMSKEDKIRACYQHCCLKYVSNDYMTNESLRKRFGIESKNYPMASKIIKDTIKNNFIKKYKGNYYVPIWAQF